MHHRHFSLRVNHEDLRPISIGEFKAAMLMVAGAASVYVGFMSLLVR